MVLSVELDDNVWVYSPGQTIQGKVVVTKNIWNKVEGLTLRIHGRVEVFTNGRSGGRRETLPAVVVTSPSPGSSHQEQQQGRRRAYGCLGATTRRLMNRSQQHEEVLLDYKISLIDSWKVLKPGRHEFEFSYEIPTDLNLPPSMKVEGARVHYEFITSLKRPRDDYKIYQTPFYICPTTETFLDEDFDQFLCPTERRAEKVLSCCLCCCSGGSFGTDLKLSRRLCSLGERLNFVVTIWNELRRDLDCVSVRLEREFKYKKEPKYEIKEIISEVCGPAVPAGENQVWNGTLQIPSSTPATNLKETDLVELNYYLNIVLHPMQRPSRRITLKCLLILVPTNAFSSLLSRPLSPFDDQNGNEDEDHPPPTYEEATQCNNYNRNQPASSQENNTKY